MTIRFSVEQELTYLRSLLWVAILCLPLVGLINQEFFPGVEDPWFLRGTLTALCGLVMVGSYFITWIRNHFRSLIYILVTLGVIWVHYILFLNGLTTRYVITTIIVLIGCSLVFQNTTYLTIYIVGFMAVTTSVAVLVQDPEYPTVAYLFQLYLLASLDYVALRNLIQSNSEVSSSGQYFKALVDNIDASCVLLDEKVKVVKFNRRLQQRLSVETGKVLQEGSDFVDFVASGEVELFMDAFKRALAGEIIHGEKPVYISKQQETWLDLKFIPVPDPEKQRSFVLFHVRDIQAIKATQEKIQKQNEDLLKANQELDRFVYLAAHDLRAPLTSLLGLIDLARRENSLDALAAYFEMMDESVQKLDRFINEVMNFSRNSRTEITRERIDFDKLINQILDSYQFIQGWNDMNKEFRIEGDYPFYSDRQRLEIVLQNLISNSWKYRDREKPKSRVQIRVTLEPEHCLISVEDNGIGIPARSRERIFDLFYKISSKSTGSGLGLYIVKETIDKLSGEIQVKSKEGKGSIFQIRIPNVGPNKAKAESSPSEWESSKAKSVEAIPPTQFQ